MYTELHRSTAFYQDVEYYSKLSDEKCDPKWLEKDSWHAFPLWHKLEELIAEEGNNLKYICAAPWKGLQQMMATRVVYRSAKPNRSVGIGATETDKFALSGIR